MYHRVSWDRSNGHTTVSTRLSGAPAEAARPGACPKSCCVAALGRITACYLMRARYVRCTDALWGRG
eukprot:4386636-Prymnesium_polylepis.1